MSKSDKCFLIVVNVYDRKVTNHSLLGSVCLLGIHKIKSKGCPLKKVTSDPTEVSKWTGRRRVCLGWKTHVWGGCRSLR